MTRGPGGRGAPPPTILTLEHLRALVKIIKRRKAFVIDLETRSTLSGHEYLQPFIGEQVAREMAKLKRQSDADVARVRAKVEEDYLSMLALDPLRNDVFWVGIAVDGASWVIPMGHPRGRLVEPEEIGDGTTVPPPGFRKILKNGEESMAKARYVKPAVYGPTPKQLSRSEVFAELEEVLFDPEILKIGHNLKFDMRSLAKYFGGRMPEGPWWDTMLSMHVLDENLLSYDLGNVIKHCFGGAAPYEREGKLGKLVKNVSFDAACRYVHRDVRWTLMLKRRHTKLINRDKSLWETFERDMYVLEVLARMEQIGVPIDVEQINALKKTLEAKIADLRLQIRRYTWQGFNPDSNPDKQKLLFGPKSEGGLGLRSVKSTKSGAASVDKNVLEALVGKHPVVILLQQWQDVQKLYGTYVEGLRSRLYKGRIHANFKLHSTVTGRLACAEPNLQNIPRAGSDVDDIGQQIRRLFIAPPGYVLVVLDYGQVELRVLAMESQDPALIGIFKRGEDVHSGTIAQIRRIRVEDVSKEERQLGKTLAFAITYGAGPDKVAATAKVKLRVAEQTIDGYYATFKRVSAWKNQALREGRKYGYVTTMSGRKRRLPDLNSSDWGPKGRAERQAINAIIQGSAADICKDAMIAVHEAFEGTPFQLVLQVHDELMAIVPEDRVEEALQIMRKAMGDGTIRDGVPIVASGDAATNWAEAK